MDDFPIQISNRSRRAGLRATAVAFACMLPCLAVADAVDARLDALHAYLASCTQEFGYDSKHSASFAEHEIAPGEAKWRDCAYDGIRKIMVPSSAVPATYDTLIALDKVMTREIPGGKRSRAERKQRIGKMIDDIIAKEKAASQGGSSQNKAASEAELLKERNQFMAREREMRKMRRIQGMMR
jgi:hypothetical protein